MSKQCRAFFAYPSTPASVGDCIRNAIEEVNAGGQVEILGWEALCVGGVGLVPKILKAIDESSLFLCDLTGTNPNVLFELGYAIGKNKRVWMVLDNSYTESQRSFDQLRVLTTVGYAPYSNAKHIVWNLYKDKPFEDLNATVYNASILPLIGGEGQHSVVYLKGSNDIEANRRVGALLQSSGLPVTVDDPQEASVQPLTWYAEKVARSLGVLAMFASPERRNAKQDNARYAFIAGLACALEKPLLMLAEGDFLGPMDYRDLLRHYSTGEGAAKYAEPFLENARAQLAHAQRNKASYATHVRLAAELRELRLGEHVAENESSDLVESYFVETAAYRDAILGQDILFVGRKGSGKTSNLLKLAHTLKADRRNLVCVIKPVAYDLQGVVELLRRFNERSERGYVIESLWKYLLFVDLAAFVYEEIMHREAGGVYPNEERLVRLVGEQSSVFEGDFTIRLERCVADLLALPTDEAQATEQRRLRISEVLHAGILHRLRDALAEAISGKQRLAILVDNLDKAWDRAADLDLLSHIMLGLLSLAPRIPNEFRRPGQKVPVRVTLAVFLRSDIFERVRAVAREPDKLRFTKLAWADRELLVRVIDERFAAAHNHEVDPRELWGKYFRDVMHGMASREFILSRILPRPRDLVVFVKSAIATAVNRGHAMVEEADLREAERQYSHYAFESILVEDGIEQVSMESVLYEFAGSLSVVSRAEVERALVAAGVPEEGFQRVIDRLCALSFLGVEVEPEKFRYADDSLDFRVISTLARKFKAVAVDGERFEVHTAFRAFLEIGTG